ncbi:MAG: tyrosine recombinase [Actinomycetota bacterium]
MTELKLLEAYLVWLSVEKGRRPATCEAYGRDIREHVRWLKTQKVTLREVDAKTLDRYVAALRNSHLASSSVARMVASIRGFYSFALSEGHIAVDPTTSLQKIRLQKSLPKPIGESEMARLLDSITLETAIDRRDAALLELLYGTGCRVSEAMGVRLGDLDFSELLIKVTGKGAKQRLVPIGATLLRALEEYLGPNGRPLLIKESRSDLLFIGSRGGGLTRQGADLVVRKRATQAGLPSAQLSAHVFRHSCATHMLEHGADIRVVQELLGHASISTTQTYTALTATSVRREYLHAHPRANG